MATTIENENTRSVAELTAAVADLAAALSEEAGLRAAIRLPDDPPVRLATVGDLRDAIARVAALLGASVTYEKGEG